eukprot:CAMPEP_0182480078 /NCGR_PEP_ID=MMETSP1319-20130603/35229_1 /TAXON_ID=172717 /ORGANISM="Bolidomonas pacifica, Strain RCC208" /LENGTH=367 /DNA_ID=CAMNT_0024681545 /DNA_START=152 /DNA_END=1251 /DNA_ORIENTATION=+
MSSRRTNNAAVTKKVLASQALMKAVIERKAEEERKSIEAKATRVTAEGVKRPVRVIPPSKTSLSSSSSKRKRRVILDDEDDRVIDLTTCVDSNNNAKMTTATTEKKKSNSLGRLMSKSSAKSSFAKPTAAAAAAVPPNPPKRQKSVEFMGLQSASPRPTSLPQNPSKQPPRRPPLQRPTIRAPSTGLRRSLSSDERAGFQDAIHAGKSDYRAIFGTSLLDMPYFTRQLLRCPLTGPGTLPSPPNPTTPARFTSSKSYLSYFVPMFMRECLAEMRSCAEEAFQKKGGAEEGEEVLVKEVKKPAGKAASNDAKKPKPDDPALSAIRLEFTAASKKRYLESHPNQNHKSDEYRVGDILLLYCSASHPTVV